MNVEHRLDPLLKFLECGVLFYERNSVTYRYWISNIKKYHIFLCSRPAEKDERRFAGIGQI